MMKYYFEHIEDKCLERCLLTKKYIGSYDCQICDYFLMSNLECNDYRDLWISCTKIDNAIPKYKIRKHKLDYINGKR